MQSLRYIDDVVTLKFEPEACVGCGACTLVCPHGVFAADQGKVHIVDLNGCMECGACVKNCPTGALSVTPGVGCAAYIIQVWIKGKEKAACGGPGCC